MKTETEVRALMKAAAKEIEQTLVKYGVTLEIRDHTLSVEHTQRNERGGTNTRFKHIRNTPF